jgi:hypothetical protein
MSSPASSLSAPVNAARIAAAHQLYCQLTGQSLRLAFDRERMWYELLRTGYSLEDLRQVIAYLQREIRAGRRNVGALKLSNFLQPDRFEEELQISRVRLRPPQATPTAPQSPGPVLSAHEQEQGRQRALEYLRRFRSTLR